MKLLLVASVMGCCTTATLFADFSYQQNSRITGGAMAGMMKMAGAFSSRAREPMSSTVMVKGHRIAHLTANTAQIIDVDKQTVTSVDYTKKTYSVMTFEQMKQMMQDMAQRMGQKGEDANVNYKVSARQTGQSKVISGLNAKEMILTITMEGMDQKSGQKGAMEIVSDVWLAPDIPGYGEVRELHQAMANKIGWAPGQNFSSMIGGGMTKGMAEAGKEMAKLDGVPVLQVITMSGSGSDMPPASSGNAQSGNTQQGGDGNSQSSAAEALRGLGRLGGLGGLGRRKKDADSSSQQPSSSTSNSGNTSSPGALMEITTESSGFSSAPVDASKFEVPSGFQQVEPEMGRRGRR